MLPLIYITQLPEYRAQIIRQKEVLAIAEGFTSKDKNDLLEIYNALLAKVDAILNKPEPQDVRHIELFEAEVVTPQAN